MRKVELFEAIRKDFFNEKKSIRQIAREMNIHRRQVRQAINSAIPPERKSSGRNCPVLTVFFKQIINQWLEEDLQSPRKQKHTGKRVYERLITEHGFVGSEITVRIYVYQKRKELGSYKKAFVPQVHMPGEEAEVDWYEAMVDFPSGREKVYIFQMRACYSGKEFHMSFSHQNQQAFLDGHVAALNYFGGVFASIRYDNLTSAVKKVFRGRKRIETDKFIALRSHYLFDAIFCLPGLQGAHEKGGVEGGVGRFRRNHFVPVPKVSNLDELNMQLIESCIQDDKRTIIGKVQSIAKDWNIEKSELKVLPEELFASAEIVSAIINKKSLAAVKNNHYSVPVDYVGQSVEAQINAESITFMKQGRIIAKHPRCYKCHQVIADLMHYAKLFIYKPGAFPGSLPLQQARQSGKWSSIFEEYWKELILRYGENDANRQLVDLLWWARDLEIEKIEQLIFAAMRLGCYQFESLKTLMRQQLSLNVSDTEPLDYDSLGKLTSYNRTKSDVVSYNLLLTKRTNQ